MPSPRDRLVDYGSSDEESSSSTPPAGCLPKAKATLGECMLDSSSCVNQNGAWLDSPWMGQSFFTRFVPLGHRFQPIIGPDWAASF